MQQAERPRFAVWEIGAVAAALAVLLLMMINRYGPHRDELYFVAAGQRLAWGYPDQPVFTPLLARLATELAPHNLLVLRLPSLMAMALLVICAAAFARLLGGGRAAQVLTASTIAASVITVTLGHRLSTATFDTLAWTAVLLVVGHALHDDRPRLWLIAGLLAGLGLNNKTAVVVLLFAILLGLLLVRECRAQLRTPYPWLGGVIAILLWLPNLGWQFMNDWPVLGLGADIAEEFGGVAGRLGLLLQALAMFSPLIAVVWIYGLVRLFREPGWVRLRPIGVAFLVAAVVFVIAGGKGYYLAGAIVPLVAAGCTALAARWSGRRLVAAGVVLVMSAAVAWPAFVPVLPVRTYAASFYPALDSDQLETIGWPEYANTVRATVDSLPADQRASAVVFTRNYGEAGALDWYGLGRPVFSGHNAFGDWGPPPEGARPVIVVGLADPAANFTDCHVAAMINNDAHADNEERGRPIWVCSAPQGSWAEQWPRLVHLDA
ncbi:MAG TPA: glycosyltransferase family 39 protein [Propionibacteriaceae bacterium]|nr:glycosyltransferase family 39 protein [Propionibacteriaceae bacterium]